MKSLSEFTPGESGRIAAVDAEGPVSQRLMVMGLLPGATVSLVQVAPMGDPITLEVRGRRLSVRRADAACIQIEEP